MSFECIQYERYGWYKRHEKRYNEASKKLVDSNVLMPHETEEFIWDMKIIWQREREGECAKQAVESAKSAVLSAQQAHSAPSQCSRKNR
ncbi:hypothetical protein HIM_03986 [Hirsutella minnesotensis 3608]|uniref:Uncharacterized protein n=1 Tax=Hirsutella minnesotensis 3608 TaxID=1043627 RepID=A0A0F7ZQ53_9HYPO|nr:hypothetical protein HIM_03986 [Hirsutella minnesotensis 3608]